MMRIGGECFPPSVAMGGALIAVRAQCNYPGVSPYWRFMLCDTRGIIVAPWRRFLMLFLH